MHEYKKLSLLCNIIMDKKLYIIFTLRVFTSLEIKQLEKKYILKYRYIRIRIVLNFLMN